MNVISSLKRKILGTPRISKAEARVNALCAQWEAQMAWEKNSGRKVVDGEVANTVDDISDLPADALIKTHDGELYQVFRPHEGIRLFCKLVPKMEPGVDASEVPLPAVLLAPFRQ